ncbi:HNH/endonuclease VII fold toxin-2 domain-containing protein, partial [Pseudomonas aeruginosa]
YSDKQTMALHKDCEEDVQKEKTACAGKKTKAEKCADDGCKKARKCLLVSYNQGKRKSGIGCCPGEQPHHLIEAHCFYEVGKRGEGDSMFFNAPAGKQPYKDTESPCVCAEGPRHAGEHGQYHAFQQALEAKHHEKSGGWTYADARNAGVKANKAVNEQC